MPKIFRTLRYEDDLVRIYKYSIRKWGKEVALRTLSQIVEVEQKALSNKNFGKLDTEYHSDIFRFATTDNSQTIFFYRLNDDVVMITAGHYSRNWSQVLTEIEKPIKAFIEQIEE